MINIYKKIVCNSSNIIFLSHELQLELLDIRGQTKILNGHTDIVTGLESINNNKFISWSEDKTIRIWNFNDLKSKVYSHYIASDCRVKLIDNSKLFTLSKENELIIWNLDSSVFKLFTTFLCSPREFDVDKTKVFEYFRVFIY